jgi:hypothetical protein
MWGFDRVARLAAILGLGAAVAGCESLGDLGNLFNRKTPLPGERQLVFPEGVPGVSQGVPPELIAGQGTPEGPAEGSAPQAAAAPETKPTPERAQPRPRQARAPAAKRPAAPPAAQPASAAPADTAPQARPAAQDSSIWGPPPPAATGQAAPWPAPAAAPAPASSAPWPDPPSASPPAR